MPKAAVEALRDLLVPGGHLFLSTPDAGSRRARHAIAVALPRSDSAHRPLQPEEPHSDAPRSRLRGPEVRTFGHHYRVGYVLDRLAYLYEGRATKVMRTLGRPLGKRTLYLNLRDVMGIHAIRREVSGETKVDVRELGFTP